MEDKNHYDKEFEDAIVRRSIIPALLISVPYGILTNSYWAGVVTFFIGSFVIGIIVSVYMGFKEYQQNNVESGTVNKATILEIDQMSGIEFEVYLSKMYRNFGYAVHGTKKSGDFGADLILKKDKKKIAVQVKRYKKNVGVRAVQEVASAVTYYRADEGWVVTNSYFTNSAKEMARRGSIRLINRTKLISQMQRS